jgi:hypothetical protein
MIVHSFDRFGETAGFDPDTGVLDTPVAGGSASAATSVHGHYGTLGETSVVFYRDSEGRGSEGLLLRAGETVVPVDDTVSVTHEQHDGHRTLRVTDRASGDVALRLDYTVPEPIVAPEDDPTPFAEAEDFDFGLFIANVASDPRRRSLVYQS